MRYKIVELNSGVVYVEERQISTERRPNGKSYEKWVRVKSCPSWEEAHSWIKLQGVAKLDPRAVKREEVIDV